MGQFRSASIVAWKSIYYAAVMTGRNTRLARLFVCLSIRLSVPDRLLIQKQKGVEKRKLV